MLCYGLVGVVAGWLPPLPCAAAVQQPDPFGPAVRELFDKGLPASACAPGKRVSLGLWTIADEKSPFGPSADKRVYDEVLSRILALRPKCADVIDSAGIGVIADHLQKSGALQDNGGDVLAALAAAHQNVDVVLFPDVFVQKGKPFLTLRLVERSTARTLALTPPAAIPGELVGDSDADAAQSLDAAIKAATDTLLQTAPDLNEFHVAGFYFEATEAQPPAARYLQEQITAALIQRGSNPLTNKLIRARGVSIEAASPDSVKAEDLDTRAVTLNSGAYELTGRYWVRPDTLELRVSLTRPDGGTADWRGSIRLADLKGIELRPSNPASLATPLPKAGFAFQVTSPRGVGPVYKPGEDLQLLIRAGQPVWLYCFYVDSQGQITTIFPLPPRLMKDRTAKIEAGKLVQLPDPNRDGFRFRFNANTVGEELVSCYATTRDVTAELPATLFPDTLNPIPFLALDKLRQTFAALRDTQVAESLVTVTVAR